MQYLKEAVIKTVIQLGYPTRLPESDNLNSNLFHSVFLYVNDLWWSIKRIMSINLGFLTILSSKLKIIFKYYFQILRFNLWHNSAQI